MGSSSTYLLQLCIRNKHFSKAKRIINNQDDKVFVNLTGDFDFAEEVVKNLIPKFNSKLYTKKSPKTVK